MKQLAISLSICIAAAVWAAGAGNAGAAAAACDEPVVTRDVSYVEEPVSDLQALDVYGFETKKCDPVPVVVWVHGGGWAIGDKRRIEEKATFFNDLGYVFVSINYRLSTRGVADHPIHPDHADDVGAAIAWVEKHIDEHGGNGNRIALLGHSAGAHLVALVGLDPDYVEQAGGDFGSVRCVMSNDTESYDLVTRAESVPFLIPNAFGQDKSAWPDASPINHVDDVDVLPDFLIVRRGTAARRAAQTQFGAALEEADGDVTYVDAPGYSHGDVNKLIGADAETVVTPPIEEFTKACLG